MEEQLFTATAEMCHAARGYYSPDRLPFGWAGREFTIDSERSVACLVGETTDPVDKAWYISESLADQIKGAPDKEKSDLIAELRGEILRLKRVEQDQRTAHEEFRKHVAEVAMEYAQRHDWCDTVKEALDEIGIEVPWKEYSFTLSVVYRVRGTKESYGEPDTYDLQRIAYLDPDVTMTMEDWGDLEVEYVQHDVMDVEEVKE